MASSSLTPRPYQVDLYQKAKERNIIAFLETGAGKTFVSVLLMQDFVSNESALDPDILAFCQGRKDIVTNLYADKLKIETSNSAEEDLQRVLSMIKKEESLIRSLFRQRSKKVVFLAPTVALVQQQAEFIQETTDLTISTFTGDTFNIARFSWSFIEWQVRIAKCQVLVLTPQVFLNFLRHGMLQLCKDISLLIFDECHHAVRNHPYNLIMQEFYHPAKLSASLLHEESCLPRIFGMTASPVVSQVQTHTSSLGKLNELMNNMDSLVVSVTSRHELTSNCKEKLVEYSIKNEQMSETDMNLKVDESEAANVYTHHMCRLVLMHNSSQNAISSSRLLKMISTVTNVLSDMGIWCAAHLAQCYAEAAYRQVDGNSASNKRVIFGDSLKTIPMLRAFDTNEQNEMHASDNKRLMCNYQESDSILHPLPGQKIDSATISNKLYQLCHIVKKKLKKSSAFRCVVFVETRAAAKVLSDFLNLAFSDHKKYGRAVKAGHIIGNSGRKKSTGMVDGDQKENFLDLFRSGDINTLVVTSVGEEGLDIPSCNLVIMFNLFKTPASYIQTRGRARSDDSRYVILINGASTEDLRFVSRVRIAENLIKFTVDSFDDSSRDMAPFNADVNVQNKCLDQFLGDDEEDAPLTIASTGASVTRSSALTVLSRYLSSLPKDKYSKSPTLDFTSCDDVEFGYQFTLKLPPSSPVSWKIFKSPVRVTKKLAMQSLALQACRFLVECGAMNDYLLSGFYANKIKGIKRAADDAVKEDVVAYTTGDESIVVLPVPVPEGFKVDDSWKSLLGFHSAVSIDTLFEWTDSETNVSLSTFAGLSNINQEVHLPVTTWSLLLRLEGFDQGFAIITQKPLQLLPSFNLFCNSELKAVISEGPSQMELTVEEWTKCRDFQSKLFGIIMMKQNDRFYTENRESSTEGSTANDLYAENIRIFKLLPMQDSNAGWKVDWDFVDRILSYRRATAPKLQVDDDIHEKLIITSYNNKKYIGIRFNSNLRAFNQLSDNTPTTFIEYYKDNYGITLNNLNDPLIEATHAPSFRNHVNPRRPNGSRDVSTLKGEKVNLVPELCTLAPLNRSEYQMVCFLPSLLSKVEILLNAFELQSSLHFEQIGINHLYSACHAPAANYCENYELLETVGDTFLKYAVTADVFCRYPGADEGSMTHRRSTVINNRFLANKALELGFPKYLNTQLFYPKQWAPPEIIPWRPKRKSEHCGTVPGAYKEMSMKMIADFTEALIGVSALHGGYPLACSFLKNLGCIRSGDFSYASHSQAFASVSHLDGIEAKLEYKFKNKGLLIEAFTHTSAADGRCTSYQRLEFLGDGALEWLVSRYFYETFGEMSPSNLTDLKQSSVNNASFGRIVVENGLHNFIRHQSPVLEREISEFVRWYDSHFDDSPTELSSEGPKVLGDVFESLTGAVLVDVGFDVDRTWEIVKKLCVPFIERHCQPDGDRQHPVRLFYETAQKNGLSHEDVEFR